MYQQTAKTCKVSLAAAVMLIASLPTAASEYLPLRFEENWGADCNKIAPKCWRIGKAVTLTFGADARVRSDNYRPLNFGIGSDTGGDSLTLFRSMAHGDLRVGKHAQMFVQFGAYDEAGRRGGPISVDQSNPDLQQGFLAWNGDKFSLRVGRQEMTLGTSRLIAVREGPNIRLAFDGARAGWRRGSYRIDAFAFRPVFNRPRTFDDSVNKSQALYGLYATLTPESIAPLKIDLYWLGYERDQALFAAAQGQEHRHSFGTRLFGSAKGWDWNTEAIFQAGRVGNQTIRAWTISSDTGFTFTTLPWSPRLGLKADIASGDKTPGDGRLGTFNALYPNPTYFSEAALLAPGNTMDMQPTVTIKPVPTLTFVLGWNFLWKHHKEDAVYTPPAPLVVIPETIGTDRYIGDQIKLEGSYRLHPQWEIRAAAIHFNAGEALTQVGGRNVNFLMTSLAFRW
ncbi:Alginate export [Nitrosomonas ureae]|uniref:Alginate export n=2 Tax=Nitrosomonas ureae TaxID=44577 RepID=A0A285BUR1_9PROT|nr:Alginate export [Nitrosomonas ureae]